MSEKNTSASHQILQSAKSYGGHMAEMLAASHFSDQEKQAWANLIPDMTPAQLERFDQILRLDMNAQAAHELEDLLVGMRAAQHKRDLSLSALGEEAHQAFDRLEKELAEVE